MSFKTAWRKLGFSSPLHLSFGLILPAWISLLTRGRTNISVWRLPLAVITSLLTIPTTLATLISRVSFSRKVRSSPLKHPPIFVLGHWRSGTTYLHELLNCNPQFAAPNGYQCFLPGHFLVSEPALRPILNLFIPKKRPMDDMVLDLKRPQEDEFALLAMTGRSTLTTFLFPARGQRDKDYLCLTELDQADRQHWLDEWLYFLQSVSLREGRSRRLVLKSPQHTARIRTILEIFPDAQFIHIARNPLKIFQSTKRTWRAMCQEHGFGDDNDMSSWLEETVLETCQTMYARYEEDRALIPDGNLIEINYEALIENPRQILQEIYKTLGLGKFEAIETHVSKRLNETHSFKPRTTQDNDRDAKLLQKKWQSYISRFGYQPDISAAIARTAHKQDTGT